MKKNMKGIDRLSDLPDEILHHILSSLDTKSSVQSSVLSRRWRSLWKYVPILTFSRDSFTTQLDFELHVNRVLSLRSDCIVRKITTDWDVQYVWLHRFSGMMKYAARHGLQHLSLRKSLGCGAALEALRAVSGCYRSLKVLELNDTHLHESVFEPLARLHRLETLNLSLCSFDDGFGGAFAKLENLTLLDCSPVNKVLKLDAAKLLSLNIRWGCYESVEIVAPKLEYLCFDQYDMMPDVSQSKFPSLVRADVSLYCELRMIRGGGFAKQLLLKRYASLFDVLHNVQSLDFYSETWKMLIQTCVSAKHQPSPFKRMKSLSLTCSRGSHEVPDEVVRYFLDGSSRDEEVEQHFALEEISMGIRHRKNWKISSPSA